MVEEAWLEDTQNLSPAKRIRFLEAVTPTDLFVLGDV